MPDFVVRDTLKATRAVQELLTVQSRYIEEQIQAASSCIEFMRSMKPGHGRHLEALRTRISELENYARERQCDLSEEQYQPSEQVTDLEALRSIIRAREESNEVGRTLKHDEVKWTPPFLSYSDISLKKSACPLPRFAGGCSNLAGVS